MTVGKPTLPVYVEVLATYHDGHRLLVCRSPLHATPRDYMRAAGQSPDCPLCAALILASDDAHSGPEAA